MINEEVWLRATLGLPSWISATVDRGGNRITLGYRAQTDRVVDPAPARSKFFETVGGSWRIASRERLSHLELVVYERVARK